jgi:predicted YcjX-like family ATPase
MPSRFTSGLYDPALVNLMSAALEAALSKYKDLPGNVALARQIMATAIISAVDLDESSLDALAAAAVRALDEAMQSSHLKTALGRSANSKRVNDK